MPEVGLAPPTDPAEGNQPEHDNERHGGDAEKRNGHLRFAQ
jgi:hypothetical protein